MKVLSKDYWFQMLQFPVKKISITRKLFPMDIYQTELHSVTKPV